MPRRAAQALLVAALAATGAAIAYAAPRIADSKADQAARAERIAAEREAAERVRVARDQTPVRGRLVVRTDDPSAPTSRRIAARRAMVLAFEGAVRDDAQRRFKAGTGDGPVVDSLCRPLVHTHGGPRDELDTTTRIGRYECLARTGGIRKAGRRVAHIGQPYVGSLDFRTGDYVLCKYHPPPGEGGVMLAQVPLDPSCFGARDRAELAALGIRETPRD